MSTETSPGLELRFSQDDTGSISGYAAVWNTPDSYGDLVQRGAFAQTLAQHTAAGTRPLMLRGHNPNAIVGTWHQVKEDETGLFVAGSLVRDSRDGGDAYALLKAGAMDGLSIGFHTVRAEPKAKGRIVHQVDLVEVSIVGRPAQPRARLHSVRSHIDHAAAAGLAAFIRQCGDKLRK